MDCSMPGFPVYHQPPELAQTQCPLSWWCHLTISSSVVPLSAYLQSFPASGSFPMSQLFASVQFSRSVISDSLWPHGLKQARLPCSSPAPRDCSSSYLLCHWCHLTISSSVVPFSSCVQSFPASGSFLKSQFFTSGGQSIGASASASVLPMNIQGWFPLGLTDLISLLSKGQVFSSTTVWKHQFLGTQPFLLPSSHICTWLLEEP